MEEVREAGLGGWFNGMDQGLLESWSGPNSDASKSQDWVRTTLLTTIGGCTLPNLVRVSDNLMTPGVLRPLMEEPLRPWQMLLYSEMSPPPYTKDLLTLHTTSPSHVLLQVRLYSLGARGGVLGQYIANTSQGNGQSTKPIPTQHTPSSFRIFQANFPAIFPAQEMVSTFTVFQIMWLEFPH